VPVVCCAVIADQQSHRDFRVTRVIGCAQQLTAIYTGLSRSCPAPYRSGNTTTGAGLANYSSGPTTISKYAFAPSSQNWPVKSSRPARE